MPPKRNNNYDNKKSLFKASIKLKIDNNASLQSEFYKVVSVFWDSHKIKRGRLIIKSFQRGFYFSGH